MTLIRRTRNELETLVGSTGLSKADLVNRAISTYYFLHERNQNGEDVFVRDADGKRERLIQFL